MAALLINTHMVKAMDVTEANRLAKTQCAAVDPASDKAILCAIWANSKPAVPVHREVGRRELTCTGVTCAKEMAASVCKQLGFGSAIAYKERQGEVHPDPRGIVKTVENTNERIITALWCQ